MPEQATVTKSDDGVDIMDGFAPRVVDLLTLSTNGVTVEISSLGASITKILLPNYSSADGVDDVVLGYPSPLEMHESGNPPFLGVVVGRVANRIAKGKFKLGKKEYDLEVNNEPNHLHGGPKGFNTRIWGMEIVEVQGGLQAVRGTLLSADGDQGYPGTILATATYSLIPNATTGATLRLELTGQFQDDQPTPINLAQHSYFNLAGHDAPNGILDHHVSLACQYYTPTDPTSIPTRSVVAVQDDPAMDLTTGAPMREVLKKYAVAKAGITEQEAEAHLSQSQRVGESLAKSGSNCPTPNQPYGIDHNYVVHQTESNLNLVGTIEHPATQRRLTIRTSAPGVQVYTGNYLDGVNPAPSICKKGATYGQWQGMCFETQHYPDSILSKKEEEEFPEFAKGKCPILRSSKDQYQHTVEYRFEKME